MTVDPTGSPSPGYLLHRGDALDAYAGWPAPTAIISDGAYGVRGFHGDTIGAEGLPGWYRPHVEAWSQYAAPATTLWFWNTELGWATVHPLLAASGWDYVQLITWDKGTAHIAGNVNGRTIRRFPWLPRSAPSTSAALSSPAPKAHCPSSSGCAANGSGRAWRWPGPTRPAGCGTRLPASI